MLRAWVICLAAISGASLHAAPCPLYPLGLVVIGDVFHATAEVEALGESQDSIDAAKAEASLGSRATLISHEGTPKTTTGDLHGVTESVCVVGRKAYATSSVSPASAAQAEKLKALLTRSLQEVPVPPTAVKPTER